MQRLSFFILLALINFASIAPAGERGLAGQWSLILPSGEAGWLEINRQDGKLAASLMWGVGSARPVEKAEFHGDSLEFNRSFKRPLSPKDEPATQYRIVIQAAGDMLSGSMTPTQGGDSLAFSGKRQPPLPPAPDLKRVKFDPPITLLNGRDLSGWRVSNPEKKNGWSMRDGVLTNLTPKTDFGAYGDYANLRTEAVFTDFQLHAEYRLPPEIGGNSGIYLRGLYEVQITHRDSKMQGINGPGAVFGRITPTRNAGKAAGEWETIEVTLVDRHITVILNGEKVIDNQPVAGCTGGALQSDVTAPGPIYLQGDHTSVEYRNLLLRPVSSTPR